MRTTETEAEGYFDGMKKQNEMAYVGRQTINPASNCLMMSGDKTILNYRKTNKKLKKKKIYLICIETEVVRNLFMEKVSFERVCNRNSKKLWQLLAIGLEC